MPNYRGYYINASCVVRFTLLPGTVARVNQQSLATWLSIFSQEGPGLTPISSVWGVMSFGLPPKTITAQNDA